MPTVGAEEPAAEGKILRCLPGKLYRKLKLHHFSLLPLLLSGGRFRACRTGNPCMKKKSLYIYQKYLHYNSIFKMNQKDGTRPVRVF